jgi:hypothetical protein
VLYGRDPPRLLDAVISEIVDHSPETSLSLLTDALSYAQAQYAEFFNAARTFREFSLGDLSLFKETSKA